MTVRAVRPNPPNPPSLRACSRLVPCDHEEADTRMILHLADAVNEGFHKILLRIQWTQMQLSRLWQQQPRSTSRSYGCTAFGTAKKLRYIPVHEIAAFLGPD